jgi:hypothetical protein
VGDTGAINVAYDPFICKQGDFYYSLSGHALPHRPGGKRLLSPFLVRSPASLHTKRRDGLASRLDLPE